MAKNTDKPDCGICHDPKPLYKFADSLGRSYYVCETCAKRMLYKACVLDKLTLRVTAAEGK